MNRVKTYIVLLLSLSVVFLFAYVNNRSSHKINKPNGFVRTFLFQNPMKVNEINIGKDCFIGGGSNKNFYLYNSPYVIYSFNIDKMALDSFALGKAIKKDTYLERAYALSIDSPYAYLYAFNSALIYKINFINQEFKELKLDRNYTKATNITDNSFVVRWFDKNFQNQQFLKKNFANSSEIVKAPDILLNDAGISTDGFLLYDSTYYQIVFTSFFRNKIQVFDTNLNETINARTIDTFQFSQAKAEGKRYNASKISYTYSEPPLKVNKKCAINNGYLYVNSALKADNEKNEIFKDNSVVDIYSLKNGHYEGSFYLPNNENEKIVDFRIVSDYLLASYHSKIILYRFNIK